MASTQDIWNLKPLFDNKETLKEAMQNAIYKTQAFQKQYKNNLNTLNGESFYQCLKEYEKLCEELSSIMTYAFLCFASNTQEGAFYAECEMEVNKAQEFLLFFELEFNALENTKKQEFMESAKGYTYYLELLAKQAKYQLSLKEEKVLLKTQPVGVESFKRLFDEHLSHLRFIITLKGVSKEVGEEEVLSLLYDKDREVRKMAQKSLSKTLQQNLPLLTYIYNVVRKDLKITAELRGYESLEESRHISNQTTQKSVDVMVETINKNVGIVEEYYTLKAKLLGYDCLYDYDRYAPIYSESEESFSYKESKKIVLETFADFSPKFHAIAKRAFDEGWVDAHPRENKRGGAFSHSAVPSAHPYLMLNHTNRRRDAFTMAHELGHTIHQYLSYCVGYLNADTPLTTAETASVFAEMLLFEKMQQSLGTQEKIALYAGKLEDVFATLFRQNVFTNFERLVHKKEGELNTETLNMLWQQENQKMFGKSVVLTENYKLWWSYIPHFIHTPFYCYAYSYGQLLVFALFGVYRRNKADFVAKYEEFLSLGGSKSPKELVEIFGFDIENSDFWGIGMQEVRNLLNGLKGIL
ncbi:M3 family oligoendopeptidase [Helicobacter turcicus]|uniref:M3 family oligoendopeptidase n=1 Tax=Helicobacter turcicus TaxID=2867412 RepID=A0ABS7JKV5_9HELI|nr:M3 family oligoendopeptidase [Helicobacter turcicus]MBX7490025.1 M3 family oligoendopeptidase [Helicobacter turcicus]MBX7544884.1 M3 family oligoendopeptidase [Helicobacter turcicus]